MITVGCLRGNRVVRAAATCFHAIRRRRDAKSGGGLANTGTPGVSPCAKVLEHGIDQLADAVHEEGDLRALPPAAARLGDRQALVRILLL